MHALIHNRKLVFGLILITAFMAYVPTLDAGFVWDDDAYVEQNMLLRDGAGLRRMWLHQANLGMNELIAKTVLGREAGPDEAPVILDEFANTSSAGSVIAFHRHHRDLATGDLGVLCSFGAGYSIGSAVLRRIELA